MTSSDRRPLPPTLPVPSTSPFSRADAALCPCRYCGTLFAPYSSVHGYCSDACGKRARHLRAGHPARVPRYVAECRRCGKRLTTRGVREHRCDAVPRQVARVLPTAPVPTKPHPHIPAPVDDFEVVWDGARHNRVP